MAAFSASGVSISHHQLERWRGNGLLPRAHQVGLGKGRGSVIQFDPGTVAQAIEISRLLRQREKRSWVGWQLWLRGYVVDNQYWELPIDEARSGLRWAQRLARHHGAASDRRQAQNVSALMDLLESTPLTASFRKLTPSLLASLIGITADILQGNFVGFSFDNGQPNSMELDAFLTALGAKAAETHPVDGNRLNYAASIEGMLHDLSANFREINSIDLNSEPSLSARREFRNLIQIAETLYGSGKEKFGRSAFGLGTLSRIISNPVILIQASMLLLWEQMRSKGNSISSVAEVEAMAENVTQWPI